MALAVQNACKFSFSLTYWRRRYIFVCKSSSGGHIIFFVVHDHLRKAKIVLEPPLNIPWLKFTGYPLFPLVSDYLNSKFVDQEGHYHHQPHHPLTIRAQAVRNGWSETSVRVTQDQLAQCESHSGVLTWDQLVQHLTIQPVRVTCMWPASGPCQQYKYTLIILYKVGWDD